MSEESVAGSAVMPSCLRGFFRSEHHNWEGGKDQSEPRGDNHTLTKEIIMFCSWAGRLRVWDTNVTLRSALLPYTLGSCASVLIALRWTLRLSDDAEPFYKTSCDRCSRELQKWCFLAKPTSSFRSDLNENCCIYAKTSFPAFTGLALMHFTFSL